MFLKRLTKIYDGVHTKDNKRNSGKKGHKKMYLRNKVVRSQWSEEEDDKLLRGEI